MSNETIVITRPKGDEIALADGLQARGYRVIHEPLTEIMLCHTERQAVQRALLAEPDAVLLTSRHGARALSLLTELRDSCLLCVGEATAQAAQSLGFTRIHVSGGNVESLIEGIAASYDPGSRFFYPSGKHVRVDLAAALPEMAVERCVVYEAVASQQLSDTLTMQLKREQIDGITFLSPRAAHIFTALLPAGEMRDSVRRLHAFCLSEAIAGRLSSPPWKGIHAAREATLASLIECVDNGFHG